MINKQFSIALLFVGLIQATPAFAKDQVRFGDARNGQKLFNELAKKCAESCGDLVRTDSLANGNRVSVKSNKDLIRALQSGITNSDKIEKTPSLLDMIDLVSHLRAYNTNLEDFGLDANRAFHGTGTLNEYARKARKGGWYSSP